MGASSAYGFVPHLPTKLRMTRWPLRILAVALLALSPIACGSSDERDRVSADYDRSLTGDPTLGNTRVRITREGYWTPVLTVGLDDLRIGEGVNARVDTELTRCRRSDRVPSKHSGCLGTAIYDYSPDLEWRLMLASQDRADPGDAPSGRELGGGYMKCSAQRHHCVPTVIGDLTVGVLDRGDREVTLFVRASHPTAASCTPSKPRSCDVLYLEPGHGRLSVVRTDSHKIPASSSGTDDELVSRLKLGTTNVNEESRFARAVYSKRVTKPGPVEIRGDLRVQFDPRSLRVPPLVAGWLVVAGSKRSINGGEIEPRNGENCGHACAYVKAGVALCVTRDDIQKGRNWINLVVLASRATNYANPRDRLRIVDGGSLQLRRYDAKLSPSRCG